MSPELTAAYEELDRAIDRVCKAANPVGGDQSLMLGDWAVIASEHSMTDSGQQTIYTRMFRGGRSTYHVAIGLFSVGLELTQDGGAEPDAD